MPTTAHTDAKQAATAITRTREPPSVVTIRQMNTTNKLANCVVSQQQQDQQHNAYLYQKQQQQQQQQQYYLNTDYYQQQLGDVSVQQPKLQQQQQTQAAQATQYTRHQDDAFQLQNLIKQRQIMTLYDYYLYQRDSPSTLTQTQTQMLTSNNSLSVGAEKMTSKVSAADRDLDGFDYGRGTTRV